MIVNDMTNKEETVCKDCFYVLLIAGMNSDFKETSQEGKTRYVRLKSSVASVESREMLKM